MLALRRACAAGVAAAAVAWPAPPAQARPGPLHIHELRGSIVRLGVYRGIPMIGVRLRATVCVRSPVEAANVYPTAIGVTHYEVRRSPRRWIVRRSVSDRAPWLVPLGEMWNGRACGNVVVEDALPPQHYGIESFGGARSCYAAGLTIEVGRRRATKRVVVRCPFNR